MGTHWRSSKSNGSRRSDLAAIYVLIATGIAVVAVIVWGCAVAEIVKYLR